MPDVTLPAGAPAPQAPAPVAAAPAPTPSPDLSGRIEVIDNDTTLPSEPGDQPESAAAGTLPEDVHPAVREERERARKYREFAEQAFVFDAQGNVKGIREDFARQVSTALGGARPADAEPSPRYQKLIDSFADRMGLLPNQVEAFVELAEAIAVSRVEESQGPFYSTSADVIKQQLIASGDVPAKAAPYVAKWIDESFKLNPKAAMTPAGRETILRQAIGEYVLRESRSRRGNVRPAAGAPAPVMLGPKPGNPGVRTPDIDEQRLRSRLGLPPTYTENTPLNEEGR